MSLPKNDTEIEADASLTAVQGIGSGGILNLSEIIVSDLVPLAERGMFMGIFSGVWALASGVGPPIVSGTASFSLPLLTVLLSVIRVVLCRKRELGAGFSVSDQSRRPMACFLTELQISICR